MATFGLIVVRLTKDGSDILRAYSSPQRLEGTRELLPVDALTGAPRVTADFESDGERDRIAPQYHHVEPFFERPTSGLLQVISGRDGSVLVARRTATPLTHVEWCGDVDGNGTDDVRIRDLTEDVVLARR